MRIQKVDTFPLFYRIPKPYGDANGIKSYRACYMIRLTTEDGVEGWGECADWLPALDKGFRDRIIPYLTGKSAAERNTLVPTISQWHSRAASAVSMALTEITAKACGLSVCGLWGGKRRNAVPVYASFQSYTDGSDWTKQSLLSIERAIADGFGMVKLKIGGKSIACDQQHISDAQALLQDRIGLALDANQSYDAAAALKWKALLEAWPNVMWLEEPIPVKHTDEYACLRQRLSVPLAGGENIEAAADFIPLLTRHAIDIVTPDPLHVAGIDDYLGTLKLARQFGARVSPHSFDGALSRLYAVMAHACLEPWSKMETEAIEPVEWDVMDNPFAHTVPVRPVQGELMLPEGHGTGLEIDMELLRFYKWDGSSYS
ncbi:mandelate racemase/muconate lactonizing enzyme family protein [Paenibacillus piri]|uniref:Mandelate racemase/muconate lactonizing enzyme family protein n=1 Tax=Paenibacillus piri TaxID=2547395 RepID=A0A4R5KIZ7_9BACL|nr:mandelate racemase/muconate lactonizing enzyme family protein [Paenibacillus piri]TDF95092.1 mandelate racemase/muconate lactonizing enzyme family protein [Paenibacillus piri]